MTTISTLINVNDPNLFPIMLENEQKYHPYKNYMKNQSCLTMEMRPILLDWMIEVCQEFTLGREVYYLAMNCVDRFLTINNNKQPQTIVIDRTNYQLLGVTCLFIVSKLEEIYPPNARDFAVTTDSAYTDKDIIRMESRILTTLKWSLNSQTPYSWLRYFICAIHADSKLITEVLVTIEFFLSCIHLIDLFSLNIVSLQYYPSALAAASLFGKCDNDLIPIIEKVTGYTHNQLSTLTGILVLFNDSTYTEKLFSVIFDKPSFSEIKIPKTEAFTRQLFIKGQLDCLAVIHPILKNHREDINNNNMICSAAYGRRIDIYTTDVTELVKPKWPTTPSSRSSTRSSSPMSDIVNYDVDHDSVLILTKRKSVTLSSIITRNKREKVK
jgi:hypothetical protein